MGIQYNAFISYRHHPDDIRVAAEIHRSLERYKVPRAIRKKTRGITRLFRDKEELPITSNLTSDITHALEHSDYLIVICSVHTKESIWVQREIETFLKTHEKSKVLTVLASGEPRDTIPEILQYEDVPDPVTGQTRRVPIEPLSCDWRMSRRRAHREELPRLAAALLNCGYDELRQRQRQYRTRRMVAAFSAVLALSLGFMAYFISTSIRIQRANDRLQAANVQIQANLEEALRNQSQYLTSASQERLEAGDRLTAISLALAALPDSNENRPYLPQAELALANAMGAYQADADISAVGVMDPGAIITDFQVSQDGKYLYILDQRNLITVWDTETFRLLASIDPGCSIRQQFSTPSGSLLLLESDAAASLSCYDPGGTALWRTENCRDIAFSPDGETLLVLQYDAGDIASGGSVLFLNPESGEALREPISLPIPESGAFPSGFPQKSLAAVTPVVVEYFLDLGRSQLCLADTATGTCDFLDQVFDYIQCASVTPEGAVLVMAYGKQAGIQNGGYQNMLVSSPMICDIFCFHGESRQMLWQSQITSYTYSGTATLEAIPGGSNILCQRDNVFQILDGSTGEILSRCETASGPLFVEVGSENAWGIFQDGSAGSYGYGENTCRTIQFMDGNLAQAVRNGAYFIRQRYGTQVTVYRLLRDESWQRFEGDYPDFTVKNKTVQGNLLAVQTWDRLYLFDTRQQSLLWGQELDGSQTLLGFSRDGSRLWCADFGGTLTEFDTASGVSGTHPLPAQDARVQASVRLLEDRFFYLLETAHDLSLAAWDPEAQEPETWVFWTDTDGTASDDTRTASIVEVSPGCVLVWKNSGVLYGIDLTSGHVSTLLEDAPARPVCRFSEDGSQLLLASGNELLLVTPQGHVEGQISLDEQKAVSLCFYGDQLLALCDNGSLYRYDRAGTLLSQTSLNLYSTFFNNASRADLQPSDITWTFTEDASLILNIFQAGNLVDCATWQCRAFIPYCVAFLPEADLFINRAINGENAGLGAYHRYTTRELIEKATGQLNGFLLSEQQQVFYGISSD